MVILPRSSYLFGTDILAHNHLLVDVAGQRLLVTNSYSTTPLSTSPATHITVCSVDCSPVQTLIAEYSDVFKPELHRQRSSPVWVYVPKHLVPGLSHYTWTINQMVVGDHVETTGVSKDTFRSLCILLTCLKQQSLLSLLVMCFFTPHLASETVAPAFKVGWIPYWDSNLVLLGCEVAPLHHYIWRSLKRVSLHR